MVFGTVNDPVTFSQSGFLSSLDTCFQVLAQWLFLGGTSPARSVQQSPSLCQHCFFPSQRFTLWNPRGLALTACLTLPMVNAMRPHTPQGQSHEAPHPPQSKPRGWPLHFLHLLRPTSDSVFWDLVNVYCAQATVLGMKTKRKWTRF